MLCYTYVVAFFMSLVVASSSSKLEVESNPNSESAKTQLQKIRDQTKHMRYGECWTKALEVLQTGCRRLTDETQRRIAYGFARCHLQASGRDIPECPEEKPMSSCTDSATIPDIAFNAYTEFFTHTQQICFHLQNQAWHQATENTISRLADNSAEVAGHLEESSHVAKEMIARQNASLKNQELLLQNEERLKDSMQKSVLDVQKSHAETKAIISEQRALFSEVFDRVAVLQKTVLGEFSSIYTFGFYVGSTLMAYILTSTTRTSGARIWLFLILIMNAATERAITHYYVNPIDGDTSFGIGSLSSFIPELIYEQTWLCRKVYTGFALFVLLASIFRYKDYNRINNNLLNEIMRQNQELQTYIKENIREVPSHTVDQPSQEKYSGIDDTNDAKVGKELILAKHQADIASVTTMSFRQANLTSEANGTLRPLVESDDTLQPSDSDGNDSDATFRRSEMCDTDSDISSVTSIMTVSNRSSRSGPRGTATAIIKSARRSSTPLREHSPFPFNDDSRLHTTVTRRSRRKSSIMALLDESGTSVQASDGVLVGGYNLRRRPASPAVNNSILERESVEQFTSYVMNHLAVQSASHRSRIRQHISENS